MCDGGERFFSRFEREEFSKRVPKLKLTVTALSGLNVNDLSHIELIRIVLKVDIKL